MTTTSEQSTVPARENAVRSPAGPPAWGAVAAGVTTSQTPLAPVYGSDDLDRFGFDAQRHLGQPGHPPFTRGPRSGMYREELWVMGQYSGAASPKQTNERIRSLLASGQRGFSIALDLPTQLGLDSDSPLARGEVGKVGVPIDTVDDMIVVLDGIQLSDVRQIRTTANSIGPIAAGLLTVAAEELGYDASQFRVMFQNDSLKEHVARGTQIFPPAAGLRFSVDLIEHTARQLQHWEPIEFCGYHYRDSGATAVQEVAFAVANALEYLQAALARGLTIDQLGRSFFMFLSGGLEFFEEAAKFRAARRIWSRIIEERFSPAGIDPTRLNIFCYTLGSSQTAQEPLNNIIRIAYQSLAAILGGAQVLATTAYDEAFQLPSDEAVRIALRTQQILAYETDAARTADPLGGSYLIETLTTDLERRMLDYLTEIEQRGGALAALEQGWIAAELETAAYEHHRAVERGDFVVVGVNAFRASEGSAELRHRHKIDSQVEAEQLQRLAEARRRRNVARTAAALGNVRTAAAGDLNTVEPIAEALRARATVGEIVSELKTVWGEWSR